MKIFQIICFALAVCLISCSDDDPVNPTLDCDDPSIGYENTTKAIIDQHCATSGCHNAAAANNTLGSLATLDDVKNFPNLMSIIAAINHEAGARPMPENAAKLDQCDIDKMSTWINNGLPE